MNVRPQHLAARSWLRVAEIAFAFMVFVLVTHFVNISTREGILIVWLCASIPMAFTFSIFGRIWSIASIFTVATSLWFAVAYHSERGGADAHDILAPSIGLAGIVSLGLFALISSIRMWRDADRKRLRRFMNPK